MKTERASLYKEIIEILYEKGVFDDLPKYKQRQISYEYEYVTTKLGDESDETVDMANALLSCSCDHIRRQEGDRIKCSRCGKDLGEAIKLPDLVVGK